MFRPTTFDLYETIDLFSVQNEFIIFLIPIVKIYLHIIVNIYYSPTHILLVCTQINLDFSNTATIVPILISFSTRRSVKLFFMLDNQKC